MTFQRNIFLLGPVYHGATLLARLLDSHPLAVCLGDTYPTNIYDQTCGCGAKVSACPFWQDVGEAIDARRYRSEPVILPVVPQMMGHDIDKWLFELLPIAGLTALVPQQRMRTFVDDYRKFLGAVYRQFERMRPIVFVDGVKAARRVKSLLAAGERIDGIIHVVRSPGDFAKSKMKVEGRTGTVAFAANLVSWRLRHQRIASLKKHAPYLRVNYESLCSDTDTTLARIFRFMELPPMKLDELHRNARVPWHFMGNASMSHFDWRISESRHPVTPVEARLANIVAGQERPAIA